MAVYPTVCWIWEGFWDLNEDRSVVAGMGGAFFRGIPYTAKSRYLRDHRREGDQFHRALKVWKRMDALWVKNQNSCEEEES